MTKLATGMKQKLVEAGFEIELTDRGTWYLHDEDYKITADYCRSSHKEEEFLVDCLITLAKINSSIHVSADEELLYEKYHKS